MLHQYLTEHQVLNGYVLTVLSVILCIVVPYFLGSLNFGVILSRGLYKEDVRTKGSGNAGSTNMLRSYGKAAGAMTLLGDALKTVVACLFGYLIFGWNGMYLAGMFCILGHMFPAYYKFKGGKGVVCLAIMVVMTDWRVFLILISLFIILVIGTKFVSLGSVICAMLYPLVLNRLNGYLPLATMMVDGQQVPLRSGELVAIAVACLVVFMHRENIKRLYRGEESKLSFKKKKKEAEKKDDSDE